MREPTREQDNAIERLSLSEGSLHVNTPYADRSVEVTAPSGACWLISPGGRETERPFNHSINWNRSA